MKKRLNMRWGITIVILSVLVLFFDYYNIPTRVGIHVENFNMDVQGIVANAIITAAMFFIAYFLVDSWDTRKHQNQQETVRMLLVRIYKECEDNLNQIDERYDSERDFQEKRGESVNLKGFLAEREKKPFEFDATLTQYFHDGTLPYERWNEYIRIKVLYQSFFKLYELFRASKENKKTANQLKHRILEIICMERDAL